MKIIHFKRYKKWYEHNRYDIPLYGLCFDDKGRMYYFDIYWDQYLDNFCRSGLFNRHLCYAIYRLPRQLEFLFKHNMETFTGRRKMISPNGYHATKIISTNIWEKKSHSDIKRISKLVGYSLIYNKWPKKMAIIKPERRDITIPYYYYRNVIRKTKSGNDRRYSYQTNEPIRIKIFSQGDCDDGFYL